jgi:uncharacterized protein YkwD
MKNLFYLTSYLSFIFLISCAGSGGSSSGSHFVPPEEESLEGCGSMEHQACEMFLSVNDYRVSQGHVPFKSLGQCIKMAQDHVDDMTLNGYFSHDSESETFQQRIVRYGFAKNSISESIARGSTSPDVILNLLKKSSVDNENLLQNIFQSIGVGYKDGYWTICYTNKK